jgi:hypothetical protein
MDTSIDTPEPKTDKRLGPVLQRLLGLYCLGNTDKRIRKGWRITLKTLFTKWMYTYILMLQTQSTGEFTTMTSLT